jgi:arylsulfatase A-like enzyme
MLAHTAPHVPLTASYADAVKGIDDSVGRIVGALREHKLEEKTLLIFSSDNGPAVDKGKDGGSPGPFRAGKYSTYEGGIRVPAIMSMPGKIKARVEKTPASLIDVFVTVVPAGAKHKVDGVSLAPLLFEDKPLNERAIFFYFRDELQACRLGKWKLKMEKDAAQLFDLESDPGEGKDVAGENTQVVARLRQVMHGQQQSTAK